MGGTTTADWWSLNSSLQLMDDDGRHSGGGDGEVVVFASGDIVGSGTSGSDARWLMADWLFTLTLVVKTCLMGLIIAASIFGNLLVIVSVARFRKLRIITNYFVVSLAMADILVALVAMGFNASVIIFGKWLFGYAMCDIWNSFDVYFCTVSILHLCCISVDRYYAISQPLMYPMKITRKKVAVMLANIWTWPALISYLPIFLGWYTTEEHLVYRQENPDRCQFVVNKVYAVISSSISFWIPCAIMLFTYYRIYEMASRQEKMLLKNADAAMLFRLQNQRRSAEMEQHQIHHIQQQQQSEEQQQQSIEAAAAAATPAVQTDAGADATDAVAESSDQMSSIAERPIPTIQVTKPDVLPNLEQALSVGNGGVVVSLPDDRSALLPASTTPQMNNGSNGNNGGGGRQPPSSSLSGDIKAGDKDNTKHLQKIRREHKAARTLGIIMGAFVLCWLPFFIWYLAVTLCGEACYCPDIVVEVLFWIGYFNSTLNPLIYAYFNKDFREAFRNTLQCIFCTRCRDPRLLNPFEGDNNQQHQQMHQSPGGNSLYAHHQVRFSGEAQNSRSMLIMSPSQGVGGGNNSSRHSSGDSGTVAGVDRIDHRDKRLSSSVAVHDL